jgi:hypothetical protein
MGNNAKRERFIRIAERRVDKLLEDFDSLGKCANRRHYEFVEDDVRKIFAALEKKMKETRFLFQTSNQRKKKFKLHDE